MPTNKTPHYNLSQWERDDRILMDDFNADNAKIDRALGELAAASAVHAALLPRLGNCAVCTGSYIGAGDQNPVVQTFPGRPVFIMVQDGGSPLTFLGTRDMETAFFTKGDNDRFALTWGDRSVSWCGGNAPGRSMNYKDRTYYYMALLAMDE